jgi:hypothetical protein
MIINKLFRKEHYMIIKNVIPLEFKSKDGLYTLKEAIDLRKYDAEYKRIYGRLTSEWWECDRTINPSSVKVAKKDPVVKDEIQTLWEKMMMDVNLLLILEEWNNTGVIETKTMNTPDLYKFFLKLHKKDLSADEANVIETLSGKTEVSMPDIWIMIKTLNPYINDDKK